MNGEMYITVNLHSSVNECATKYFLKYTVHEGQNPNNNKE
jgi:hypothetical protein